MPHLRNYDIFISHAWAYGYAYDNLIRLLDAAPNFKYRNYSAPVEKPLMPLGQRLSEQRLAALIDNKVRPAQCVLVIAGMYAAYKYWIDKEIAFAERYGKPIIGLIPWGQQRVPVDVQARSHELVHWSTSSIVDAIRRRAL